RAGRPQPGPPPGHEGRRGGRLPARRPPLLRPGLLRPRQPVLPGVGPDQPRPRGVDGVAGRVGPRDEGSRRILGEARGRALGRADPGPGPVRVGRLRGLPLMATWSKSEMLVVAGARALAGKRVWLAGIRLPHSAVPLPARPATPVAKTVLGLFSPSLQGALVDVGFVGAAQLARFGNTNTTVIGDYD